MYEEHFGVQRPPFRMSPDTEFLFLTEGHREALAGLIYSIVQRKGFTVLVGEAGTGKSTLLQRVLETVPAQTSLVTNPRLSPAEFLEYALLDFGLEDLPASKAQRLMKLQNFLLEAAGRQEAAVLIVDEAHTMSPEVLEEIRLLTNLETPEGKLLQIVLAGQDELSQLLNRDDLRQLKQRVAVRLNLRPLTASQAKSYIGHRWKVAGGEEPPFDDGAYSAINLYSRGVPRLINVVADNALLTAFSAGEACVTGEHVHGAARDLDLVRRLPEPTPPADGRRAAPVAKQEAPPAGAVPGLYFENGILFRSAPPSVEREITPEQRGFFRRLFGSSKGEVHE